MVQIEIVMRGEHLQLCKEEISYLESTIYIQYIYIYMLGITNKKKRIFPDFYCTCCLSQSISALAPVTDVESSALFPAAKETN